MNYTIDRVGWNAPHCERATLQLIYSCLSTIFLCTWTVFHDEVYYGDRIYRRFWWMVVAIFAPEITMFRALRQYIEARDLTNTMLTQRRWSVEHSWLTNMGGIRLIWVEPNATEAISHREHALVASEALTPLDYPPATGAQLFWLLQKKRLDIDTFPTVAEIRDKSKTSYLLKALSCGQGIWLFIVVRIQYLMVTPNN